MFRFVYLLLCATVLAFAGCQNAAVPTPTGDPVPEPPAPIPTPGAPAAPGNFTATADGTPQVKLTWTAPSGTTWYILERRTSDSSAYSELARFDPQTSYTDKNNLSAGVTYYYRLIPQNSSGAGSVAVTNAKVPGGSNSGTAPAAPANFSAKPNLNQINLSWAASSGASDYLLERKKGSSGTYAQVATPTAAAYTDSNLEYSTLYFYRLKARNSAGSSGTVETSATTGAAPTSPPSTPSNFSGSADTTPKVTLSWTAPSGATSYLIERRTGAGAYGSPITRTSTGYTDSDVQYSTTYTYRLKASNGAGNSGTVETTVTTPAAPPPPNPSDIAYWTASSMERVRPDDAAKANTVAEIYAAKGEYEGFQVIVKAPSGSSLSGVNFAVSDLSGPGGATIAKSNLTLYREHYVQVTTKSGWTELENRYPSWNRSLGTGWYPDALIPFNDPNTGSPTPGSTYKAVPVDIAAGKNQPFWVDVFVPRGSAAGLYTGKYTISAGGTQVQGDIKVNVWNFELPLKPSMDSQIPFWSYSSDSAKAELLRHKLMPKGVDSRSLQRDYISKYGLKSGDMGYFSGAVWNNCSISSPLPSLSTIQTNRSSWYEPGLMVTNYSFDEIDTNAGCVSSLASTIKQWARDLHSAGILQMATMGPVQELLDDGTGKPAIDIYIMAAHVYKRSDKALIETAKAKSRFWSYTALINSQNSGATNSLVWQIDYKPTNFRIMPGFLNQSLGFSGIFYWAADETQGKDRWTNPVYTNNGYPYNGDGYLLYKGDAVGLSGPVPSMRLKWIRDGVEDFEYIEQLKAKNPSGWLAQVRGVATDYENWNPDSTNLEDVRRAIGNALSQ